MSRLNTYRNDPTPPVAPGPQREWKEGRSAFLRATVDMIDRAALNHVLPEVRLAVLERFVQDWRHHARAPILVELGEVLEDLVAHAGFDEKNDDVKEWKERSERVEEILSKVPGVDRFEDLDVEYMETAYQFIEDLAKHHNTNPDKDGIREMRDKLIGDGASDEELRAEVESLTGQLEEVKKERDEAEREKRVVERDRDDLMAKCEAYEKTLREMRATITTALPEND